MWLCTVMLPGRTSAAAGGGDVLPAHQLSRALERKALFGVAADLEQLFQVLPGVVRGAGLADGCIDESQLDVVADRAAVEAGEVGELVQGVLGV